MKTQLYWQNSILFKIGLILIILTTLILSGFGIYQYRTLKSREVAYLNDLGDTLPDKLVENVTLPFWDYRDKQVEGILFSEMREKNVYAIIVRSANQKIFKGKKRDEEGNIVEVTEEISGDFLVSGAPIIKDTETLGSVELYLTEQIMFATLKREIRNLSITIIILDLSLLTVLTIVLRKMLIRPINHILTIANAISDGDFSQTVTIKQQDEIGKLANAFQMMKETMQDVVASVKSAADNVAAGSYEIRISSEGMSQGAAEQASSTEEVSASIQQMSANIRQNADNARQTEKIAQQSAEYAEEGGRVVGETVVVMQQIAEKITIIEEIADQTRILSLNATIEAVRAQDHGKAFSVVAAEVRKLSDVTKRAAEEINKLATSSLKVSVRAGEMLTTLVPSIHRTAELVQEISASSNEQCTGAEQVNKAVQQLDQVTQQNAIMSESLATAAEELAAQAEQLQRTMKFFSIHATNSARIAGEESPTPPVHPSKPPVEDVTENSTHREVTVSKGLEQEPSSRRLLDMNHAGEGEDEYDAEFERY